MSEQYTPTINKEELASGVVVYKDVIPGYHQLIPYVEQVVGAGMATWMSEVAYENFVNTMTFFYPVEFTDPNDFSVTFEERLSLVLGGFLGFVETDYMQTNNLPKIFAHTEFKLTKYDKGVSFPVTKYENTRMIVVLYFLNDDYSGSTFEFTELGITYQPKANEALIFPSADVFKYSISELTEGTKYVVSSSLIDPSTVQ